MMTNCPSCGSRSCKMFYESLRVPIHNNLLASSRTEAISVSRGDLTLKLCTSCGLVFNSTFDFSLWRYLSAHEDYSNYMSALEVFQERLANRLVERYAFHGNDIPPISCQSDEILTFVCGLSDHHRDDDRYISADPVAPSPEGQTTIGVAADLAGLPCTMMALMQVPDPVRFLTLLRRVLAGRGNMRLLLQVLDFARTLKHIAFWDIQYGYCSYFAPGTLHRLLSAQGFVVSNVWRDFGGQVLMVADDNATSSHPRAIVETIADLESLVDRFAHECRQKQALWCEILSRIAGTGKRIAIWGAGSSAAAFLTTLAVGDEVSYVIDPDPSRHGKYTPGTGHRIVAPDAMLTRGPDVVIVMNSVLTFEIQELLAEAGRAPTILIA